MWGFAVVGLLAIVGVAWLLLSSRSQLLGHFPYRGPTTHKVIALTFDDGPNEPYTSQIADYLHSQGIHATFFQVGQCVERHPLVSRRLSQDGHVIGNHSMTHRFGHYLTQPRYRQELARCQDMIATQIGHRPALFRPPWLWRGPLLFGALRHQHLMAVSGEFCHPLEVAHVSAQRIARRALAKAKPGSILIFHDGYNSETADRSHTVEAVRIVVPELQRRGYAFVTVSGLLGLEPYQPDGPR